MIQTLVNMAWSFVKTKFSNMFNPDKLLNDSYNIAMNQGLPALIQNLEQQARSQGKGDMLNHKMWQAVKGYANNGNPENVVSGMSSVLKESGQAEAAMEFLRKNS